MRPTAVRPRRVAGAHVTKAAMHQLADALGPSQGSEPEQIMEAIWVTAETRAGGAHAHATLAMHALGEAEEQAEA